jgi:hypothetical protein
MTSDEYTKAAGALRAAIRGASELASALTPELVRVRELALEKRAMEKQLRAAGYTKVEAQATVSRTFKIQKLGDGLK